MLPEDSVPYCGPPPAPGELWSSWNVDVWVVAALGLVWVAHRLAQNPEPGADRFALAGLGVLAVAFMTPLCALSSALFSARVTHHALLLAAAAPLLAAALPRLRRGLLAATVVQTLVIWFWHAPAPYAWALAEDARYGLMEASLLGAGVVFWSAARGAHPLAAAGALLVTMMLTGVLGALITFAGQPLYGPHLTTTYAWGLDPLQDQQLAGLIMWAPMALAYLLPALARVGRWLDAAEAPREARA